MIREMARAKLGGYFGYSFSYVDFPDSTLNKWQGSLDALLRDKERLTAFASTSQVAAPTPSGGLGGLDLITLRDSNTIAVFNGGLNATALLNGPPSIQAATLREHLKEWKRLKASTPHR